MNQSQYPIRPININAIDLSDHFWLPKIKTVQNTTIGYALRKCEDEGRMDNFLIAGGKKSGTTRGHMPFDDTDVYKIIEGASYTLISAPDSELEVYIDEIIDIIKTGQEEDGYLTTWKIIDPDTPPAAFVKPGGRWKNLDASHELYNSGHLFEAAAAHYRATGKRSFLDIALKNADLLVKTFGPDKIIDVPGHQIVETGLIKLSEITGRKAYLELAKFFLDLRGNSRMRKKLYGAYSQDHLPVTQQTEVTGHAVRAVYMYAAMTDIAALTKDTGYLKAVNSLWENMVYKKLYITGGIGAKHEGEAFGENYELPNLTAYSETCAAIGSVYWNHRLFILTGDSRYFDIIERTLYNAVIPGISIEGDKFFYPNPLESDGKFVFNNDSLTRKPWFDCSCCPTNLIRFIPTIPELLYAKEENSIFINLFAESRTKFNIHNTDVEIIQNTEYPWNGNISITINPATPVELKLKIRIPGWVRNKPVPGDLYKYSDNIFPEPEIFLNGVKYRFLFDKGYTVIERKWNSSDKIQLNLPMSVRMVTADKKVKENINKAAIEYGPIVYCAEGIDNNNKLASLVLPENCSFSIAKGKDIFKGVIIIKADAVYREGDTAEEKSIMLIPYYLWCNRGPGEMKVWLLSALDSK